MQKDPEDGIYRSKYSGVAVYEMLIQGVSVMRRRADSYLNATHILKLAGMDKGKRTKILEREVVIGEHEKVQGGYGKYQGTWIPLEKGKELAERYGVLEALRPIIEFNVDDYGGEDQIPTKEQGRASCRASANTMIPIVTSQTLSSQSSPPPSPNFSVASSPACVSPCVSSPSSSYQYSSSSQNNRKHRPSISFIDESHPPPKKTKAANNSNNSNNSKSSRTTAAGNNDLHRHLLMGLFLSDDPVHVPELFQDMKNGNVPDIDIDLAIDDQGHTALHWAASLARIKTVELLVSRGADICKPNDAGETPLMRGAMMTNCYDNDCFPKLLDILKSSTHKRDQQKRTVLHHAVLTTGKRGREDAGMYYVRHLLETLSRTGRLQTLIDVQDVNGDTALSLAMHYGNKELIDLISSFSTAGSGKALLPPRTLDASHSNTVSGSSSGTGVRHYGSSQRSREIVSTVQKIVDALDADYSEQLREKDQELERVQAKLRAVSVQLSEARRKLEEQSLGPNHALNEAQELIRKLEITMQHDNMSGSELMIFEDDSSNKSPRERWLEQRIRDLEAQMEAQSKSRSDSSSSTEKEMQCKRLIAACCSLPVEKVDILLEPLLAAVESDPPDLDFDQVIQFMEKLRQPNPSPQPKAMEIDPSPNHINSNDNNNKSHPSTSL